MPLRLFLDRLTYRGVPRGLGNSQSSDENIFRMDNLARGDAFFAQQMADDAETENIALSIRFVDERDYIKKFFCQAHQGDVVGKESPFLVSIKGQI